MGWEWRESPQRKEGRKEGIGKGSRKKNESAVYEHDDD
jgi:hypothetical protein